MSLPSSSATKAVLALSPLRISAPSGPAIQAIEKALGQMTCWDDPPIPGVCPSPPFVLPYADRNVATGETVIGLSFRAGVEHRVDWAGDEIVGRLQSLGTGKLCVVNDWAVDLFLFPRSEPLVIFGHERAEGRDILINLRAALTEAYSTSSDQPGDLEDGQEVDTSPAHPWIKVPEGRMREIARAWFQGAGEGQIAARWVISKSRVGNIIGELRKKYGLDVIPHHRPSLK